MRLSDNSHSIKQDANKVEARSEAHPDLCDLTLLRTNKKSFNHSLNTHVAECVQCQKQLTILSHLNLSHHTLKNTSISEGQQNLIVDYISRGFSINRKRLLRQKIQDETTSLKALLHYASHSEAMRLSLKQEMDSKKGSSLPDLKKKHEKTSSAFLSTLSGIWMKFKLPFTYLFKLDFTTLYSVLISIAVIVLLLIVLTDRPEPTVANAAMPIQEGDNNRIELEFIDNALNDSNIIYVLTQDKSESGKNIASANRKTVGKVNIHLNEKQNLHIAWPESSSVHHYTIAFYALPDAIETPILKISTSRSFVDMDVKNFTPGKSYRWVFSYQTSIDNTNNKTFRAKGRFVIKSLKPES